MAFQQTSQGAQDLQADFARIRVQATALAGGTDDLERRANLYRQIYRHSAGLHGFPLLAAHGSLWARGYFRMARQAASVLSLAHAFAQHERQRLMAEVDTLIEALRDINRRVFLEIYATYQFTSVWGETAGAETIIDPVLLDGMNRCHAARRQARSISSQERRALFEAFIRWEQTHVVAAPVEAAVAAFQWPMVKALAMRPRVSFTYIPIWQQLQFVNFASKDERISRGLDAFDIAERVGWDQAELALDCYRREPDRRGSFFTCRACPTTAAV